MSAKTFHPEQLQIGSVYAKGILAAATQNGEAQAVVAEMESLQNDVLDRSPQLITVLGSTRVSMAEKSTLIDTLFKGRASATFTRFLKVICQHGRFDCIGAIIAETRRLHNLEQNIVEVLVTTAAPLSDADQRRVMERLESALKKSVTLQTLVDPSILGGLQIRVGDTVFDGSLQAQLERIRKATVEKAAQKIRGQFDRFSVAT